MIYNISGVPQTPDFPIEFEGGTISSSGIDSYDISSFGTYSRSAYLIRRNNATKYMLDMRGMPQSSVTAVYYKADRTFLSTATVNVAGGYASASFPTNSAFVRFTLTGVVENINAKFDGDVENAKRIAMYSPTERFTYRVYDGICNTGRMLLPPNYDPDGDPVPLIIYMHGSQSFTTWTSEMQRATTWNKYLADEGFAVMDLFGWTSKYAVTYNNNFAGNDPYCIPLHVSAHEAGVKYVCSRYNVDIENIHVVSKSMGGMLALYCVLQNPFNVRSVGMFAPVLDYISIRGAHNPTSQVWEATADELGFVGDVDDWKNNYMYEADGVAYINLNKEAFISLNPAWQCLIGQTLQEKVNASIDNCQKYWTNKARTDIYQDTDLAQIGKVPCKIWGAPDDESIPYLKMVETVAQLNNGGLEAHMRTLPTGCGGHFATDDAASTYSAIRTNNVTTACGVHYDYVPTAYYENVQWIRLRCVTGGSR